MSKIFPAATVVLVRDGSDGLQVLLLRRSKAVSFAEGLWVFPGGKIDKTDYVDDLDDIETAARRGAVRETLEEVDLLVEVDNLYYFAHWTTPPENPRRYATWFYISEVSGNSEEVTVDGSEIIEHRWCSPAEAIADQQAKLIAMMPPTFVTLSELAACDSVAEAMTMYRKRPVAKFLPKFTKTDEGIAMLYSGDAGYELADQTVDGPKHRIWMLEESWRYEKSQ